MNMSAGAHGNQRYLILLELGFQTILNHMTRVLGTESSGRDSVLTTKTSLWPHVNLTISEIQGPLADKFPPKQDMTMVVASKLGQLRPVSEATSS